VRRTGWIAGALAALTLTLAGCGAAEGPAAEAPALAHSTATPAPDVVAATVGRLGPATTASAGRPPVQLSDGGRLDVRPRDDAPPREGVGAAAACPAPGLAPVAESLPAVLDATLCLVNAERVDRGLPRLTANVRLATAARRYAADLVAGGYFSHTGRDGSSIADRLERAGYLQADRAWVVGENLAWGTGPLATPEAIVRAWMNSPGHRENILHRRYREIGMGVVLGNPAGAEGVGATYASAFGAVAAPPKRKPARKRSARTAARLLRR
jgi:uncharacterized protein YkwD